MLNYEMEDTVSRMRRYGGSFVEALGNAILNADHGHSFAVALLDLHGWADAGNQAKLRLEFPNLWTVCDLSQADRIGHLRDAFPEQFEKYGPTGIFATKAEGGA